MKIISYVLCVATSIIISGCATRTLEISLKTSGTDQRTQMLFDASSALDDNWFHQKFKGSTEYRLKIFGGRVAIRAVGRNSASGLIRRVDVVPQTCPILEWVWSVTELQANADVRRRDKEDVAASLFLLFGDPGFLSNPEPVPTLRYVWTNNKIQSEDAIDNPYYPGVVRSIIVRRGKVGKNEWMFERRNLLNDFNAAFGYSPKGRIHAFALFTDNDQTKQPVTAYYGWARVICGP